MALTPADMRKDFETVLDAQGTACTFTTRLPIYTGSFSSEFYKTGSDVTTSGQGCFEPIAPQEARFLPQGRASMYPRKLYVHGSLAIDSTTVIRDSAGSRYEIIPSEGTLAWPASGGVIIYYELFVQAQIGSEFEYA